MIRYVVALLFCLAVSSCSVSDRLVYQDAEGVVPDAFFSSVKKNRTEKSWIIDHLGEPQEIMQGADHQEILTYNFTRTRYRHTSLLIVLRYNGSENDVEHYHVVLCDDVVKKAWWDKLPVVKPSKVKCDAKTEMENDLDIDSDVNYSRIG